MSLAPETIRKSIEALLNLQEIDAQLFKLRNEEKVLPPEMAQLKAKLDEAQKAYRGYDRTFKELDRERRALELRTLTLQEDLKRAEVKRREVRNTKEEFAANKEFEAFQKKVAEIAKTLEDRQKATQEKQQIRDEKQKVVESLEADLKAADIKRSERIQEIHQQIKALEDKRHDFIGQVDEEVFSIYERVQKIRSGNGIAYVKGLMCSGCFVSIPPQLALMLDKMDSVITCPSCSRILYPANDANSSTAA